jgi:methyl-accepting chemotaxis protein
VQEINAASSEQSEGIEQVTKAIHQLDQVIQQNSAATEAMSTSAGELSEQSERLLEVSAFFKIEQIHRAGENKRTVDRKKTQKTAAVSRAGASSQASRGLRLKLDDATDQTHFERQAA